MTAFVKRTALYMQSMILGQIMIDAEQIIIPKFNFCQKQAAE